MSESDDHFPSPKRRSLRRQQQSTQQPTPLNCPRCESTNTKFCYYNNYNKTQPRYFCKACKRHWTKGGTLRNVPIGGGRKNKRLRRRTIITATPADDQTSDVSKASLLETSKRRDDAESYTDIEELKGLVSWDFYESFQETSSFLELSNSSWINDLDIMVFEDLNKPWEDPTFESNLRRVNLQ